MNKDSRCGIYARYSSHAQREESIEQQITVCREYCARRGLDVLRVYADAARSGPSCVRWCERPPVACDARLSAPIRPDCLTGPWSTLWAYLLP